MKTLRQTKMKDWLEYYREPCPICDSTGGCMVHRSGDRVVCIRETSDIQFSVHFPSWVHYPKGRVHKPADLANQTFIEGVKKRSNAELNRIYRTMMDHLVLSDQHYTYLTSDKRQLNESQIKARAYKSVSQKPWEVAKATLLDTGERDLIGVPGFYRNDYGWSIAGNQGVLIPYRNDRNEIIGYQIRIDQRYMVAHIQRGSIQKLDARVKEQPDLVQVLVEGEIIEELHLTEGITHNVFYEGGHGTVTLKQGPKYLWLTSANKTDGTGAGNPLPVHVAVPSAILSEWETGKQLQSKSVWITEGGLKADIASDLIHRVLSEEERKVYGSVFLAAPGINTWNALLPVLKRMGVEKINIAIDMDAVRNVQVAKHLVAMRDGLKKEGYKGNIAMWNVEDGVGIDDLLLAKKKPQVRELF